jgi:uncharacterized membrane protein YeaQ/YmgE (transglycosylase-associated protein family)
MSPNAQHCINIVLIWVGFGTLAGLLATAVFPFRRIAGPFWIVVAGICGSMVGLFGLSLIYPDRNINPFEPLGFLAATLGTFALLALYRLGIALFGKPNDEKKKP